MGAWYLRRNEQTLGPYTLDELKVMHPTNNEFIWSEGFTTWRMAASVTELHDTLLQPPPFNNDASKNILIPRTRERRDSWNWIKVVGVIVVLTCLGGWVYNSTGATAPIRNTTIKTLDEEKVSPASFLTAEGTFHFNLIDQFVVQGTIHNNASHSNYKDAVIRVTFYSETKSSLGSLDFTEYKYVPYGGQEGFKWKMQAPAGTKSCGLQLVSAKNY